MNHLKGMSPYITAKYRRVQAREREREVAAGRQAGTGLPECVWIQALIKSGSVGTHEIAAAGPQR